MCTSVYWCRDKNNNFFFYLKMSRIFHGCVCKQRESVCRTECKFVLRIWLRWKVLFSFLRGYPIFVAPRLACRCSNHGDNKDMVRERRLLRKRARRIKSRTCGYTQKRKRAHKPSDRTANQSRTDGVSGALTSCWSSTEPGTRNRGCLWSLWSGPCLRSLRGLRSSRSVSWLRWFVWKSRKRTVMTVIWPLTSGFLGPRHITE